MRNDSKPYLDALARSDHGPSLMCRIASYIGPEIPLENIIVRPNHSLLAQSQKANEAKLAVNGDGFGVSWYNDTSDLPGLSGTLDNGGRAIASEPLTGMATGWDAIEQHTLCRLGSEQCEMWSLVA